MKDSVNREKKAGRPKGRKAMFPGITAFCRHHGYSHQHVRRVLTGRETSARVRGLWAAWSARRLAR
jgi:hypothetical protein